MQLFKSAVVAVMALAALAVAAPEDESKAPCKPALQSCSDDYECCSDLCLLGVSATPSLFLNTILT